MPRLLARIVLVAACMLLAFARAASSSEEVSFPQPESAVNQYAKTTYLDLARHFVPDIKLVDGGYLGKVLTQTRHIGGPQFSNGGQEGLGFFNVGTTRIQADGKERMIVLFDLGQAAQSPDAVAILALYDVTKEVKLLDAVDVGFDKGTFFFREGLMPVSPTSDVILTMSMHFNSSQTYVTYPMIMVSHDKLRLIDTIHLFDDRLCTAERKQEIHYAADPAAGKPYAPIHVTVTETTTPTGADCGQDTIPPLSTRKIDVTYTWNVTAEKYVKDSDALEKLAASNQDRF